MNARHLASERQLILSVLAAIATHPLLEQIAVYHPIIEPDKPPERVKVVKWRTYGGLEIKEAGLTVSVYPYWYHRSATIELRPYTLGTPSTSSKYLDELTTRLVVELAYQDAELGIESNLPVDVGRWPAPQGRKVMINANSWLLHNPYIQDTTSRENLEVEIMPGEEILRQYVPIMRAIIRDIPTVLPFNIRQARITSVEYQTSDWSKDSKNFIFHAARIYVSFVYYEPALAPSYRLTPVTEVNLQHEVVPPV